MHADEGIIHVREQVDPILETAFLRFYEGEQDSDLSGFTEAERITVFVALLAEYVPIDGLHGWLRKISGMFFNETVEALDVIGAEEFKVILLELGGLLDMLGEPRCADADIYVLIPYLAEAGLERRFCDLIEDDALSLYVKYWNWYNSLDDKPFRQ